MNRLSSSLLFYLCYLLCLPSPTALSGQTPCGADYTRLVTEGDSFLKKGMYKDAFEKYRAARGCTEAVHQELDKKTAAVLHAVEGEREKADRNAIMARRQQRKAEAALKQAEIEKAKAEASEEKANAVLNKIYFFEDRFGLAYDKNEKVYGYIDKNLDTKIEFKYVEAMPFDYTGYAWVKKQVMGKQYDFLIDTFGNEYPLRYYVEEMDESTSALDLRNQDLEVLPAALFQKTQLKVLFLGMNQLAALPPEIGQLKNLIFLGVSWNQLQGLPPEIGQLDHLKALQLAGNQISQLPPELGDLENLESLIVSGNQLTYLPPEIGNLKKLSSLQISGNELSQLPPSFAQLQSLKFLDASFNKLEKFPVTVCNLENLQALCLSGTKIASLPTSIGKLHQLRLLDLSANQIGDLPETMGMLENLRTLKLNSNQVKAFPQSISSLKNLQELNIVDNLLEMEELNRFRRRLPQCRILPEENSTKQQGNLQLRDHYLRKALAVETRINSGDTSVQQTDAAYIYNELAWYQLITGQFYEAEHSIKRGQKIDANYFYLTSKLPSALLLQQNSAKEAEAFRLYRELKDRSYLPPKYPKFKDAFFIPFTEI